MDTADSVIGVAEGKGIPRLNENGGVDRVNPVFQLLRRAKVCTSKKEEEYKRNASKLPRKPKEDEYQNHSEYKIAKEQYYTMLEQLMNEVDQYIESSSGKRTNLDKVYDELSQAEILEIYEKTRTISMKSAISNAINQGIGTKKVRNVDENEYQIMQGNEMEGVSKDEQ